MKEIVATVICRNSVDLLFTLPQRHANIDSVHSAGNRIGARRVDGSAAGIQLEVTLLISVRDGGEIALLFIRYAVLRQSTRRYDVVTRRKVGEGIAATYASYGRGDLRSLLPQRHRYTVESPLL